MNYQQQLTQTQTLIELFNALADRVQALADRNTILEHKLRYAHEQVSSASQAGHLAHHAPCPLPPLMMIIY